MLINEKLTIAQVAAIVSTTLEQAGIIAVLSGGSVVSIYSENEYKSQDLDFISSVVDTPVTIADEGFSFQPVNLSCKLTLTTQRSVCLRALISVCPTVFVIK